MLWPRLDRRSDIYRCIALILLIRGMSGIRIEKLEIPETVQVGQPAKLVCRYDLEGHKLYAIKWYRGDQEFLRFVPSEKPPWQYFPIAGVKVDLSESTNGTVYIRDTNRQTTGIFRCEISADAPSFETASAQMLMTIQETNGSHCASVCSRNFYWTCLSLVPLTMRKLTYS